MLAVEAAARCSDTLNDILASPEREAWIDWLRQRRLAVFDDGQVTCLNDWRKRGEP